MIGSTAAAGITLAAASARASAASKASICRICAAGVKIVVISGVVNMRSLSFLLSRVWGGEASPRFSFLAHYGGEAAVVSEKKGVLGGIASLQTSLRRRPRKSKH